MAIRMRMITPMIETLSLGQLSFLLTWSSPAFPTGAFSYSHGIEFAVEQKLVKDADTLRDWVGWILRDGALYADAVFLAEACRALEADDWPRVREVAALAAAMRGTAELGLETRQQGASFLATARALWPSAALETFAAHDPRPALPIAVALVAARAVPLAHAVTAFLHAGMANLVSAGVRLVPLGQTAGQQTIAALEPAVRETVARALATPLDELATAAPMVDWTSMRHETQYTRLFRS